MFRFPPNLDEPFVHAIRAGHQRFEAVQQQRLVGNDDASGQTVVDWSNDFHAVATQLTENGDNDVNVLWSLTTMVLQVGLQGERNVNFSQAFCAWYNTHFIDADATSELMSVFSDVPLNEPLSNLAPLFRQVCQFVLRLFAFGRFKEAAELLHQALERLRQEPGIERTYLDEPAEQRLADVLRLLMRPFNASSADESEFIYWRECAHRVVYDARVELKRESEDERHPAAELKNLALNLLLVMTGDRMAMKDASRAIEADLNILDYVCGICSAVKPFLTLSQVHELLIVVQDEADPLPVHHWYLDIVTFILKVREKEQMTVAMDAVYQATTDERFVSEGIESVPEGESEEAAHAILFRRAFCLRFLAVHVADLCAPSFVGDISDMESTFIRHRLITSFVTTYLIQPELLVCRLRYCAYATLMDPHVTYQTLIVSIPWAVQDKRFLSVVERTVLAGLDEGSLLQRKIREFVKLRLPRSKTVDLWFRSFYDVVREGLEGIMQAVIVNDLKNSHTVVGAVRLAADIQRFSAVEGFLFPLLQQQDFFSSAASRQIGEAVHNGHLELRSFASNPKILVALEACATVFDAHMFARVSSSSDPLRATILKRALSSCSNFCSPPAARFDVLISFNALIEIAEAYVLGIESIRGHDSVERKAAHLLVCNTFVMHMDSSARLEGDDYGQRLDSLGRRILMCMSHME